MSDGLYGMSSPQYSTPTEQHQVNGGSYYQTSEPNMGPVYTSSNSLVISGTGRMVYSNPGSPKSMMDTRRLTQHNNTSYCEDQLPLARSTDTTVVIGDDNHTAYRNAMTNSNMFPVMTQEGGDLPNEMCNSHNSNLAKLRAKINHSAPIDPLQGGDVYFRESPNTGTNYSADAHSDVIDVSVLADSNSIDMGLGQCLPSEGGISSMVTGVGGGGGRDIESLTQIGQPPQQLPYNTVFEDDISTLLRDFLVNDETGSSLSIPDPEFLKFIDNGMMAEASGLTECLSTPVSDSFINGFGEISIQQPVQAQDVKSAYPMPVMMGESIQEQTDTGDHLDMIKMMNVQIKAPTAPASLGLKQSHMVPTGHIPSPMHSENNVIPQSPATPFTPHPPPTPIASIEASAPSPAPQTPQTPRSSAQKGPFELKSYVEEDERVCELSVRADLSAEQCQIATQAMFFSVESNMKISDSAKAVCDLKVAIDARAELASSKFDFSNGILQFTIPKDCMHLDKWLSVHKETLDLRDRQLVLQQVINLVAAVHKDQLCLWGSFVVWVAPDKRVYLLIDFPDMLSKMESHATSMTFDPRCEDVRAIYKLYTSVFQPFVNQDSSWVSPGVKQLIHSFDTLIVDPSSVYRIAELARTLGERRLCKLEVELMTLTHYVYCIEHEHLQGVLSHITSMVPPVACDRWEVQWAETGQTVGCDVMASAHRRMRLLVQPVQQGTLGFAPIQNPAAPHGLTFQSSCLSPF